MELDGASGSVVLGADAERRRCLPRGMVQSPQPPERRRGVRIAMMIVPAVLTIGLAAAWFAIRARTGGNLSVELGSRGGTPARFSLIVVGIVVLGMATFTVVAISIMRRSARTPPDDGVDEPDDESPASPA